MEISVLSLRRPAQLLALGLVAAAAAAAEPAAEKNFVLFMGADIDVQQGKEAYRVKNVAGDAFVITVDNQPVEVPMNRGKIGMKVTPQLKLSDKTAAVKDLKFERAYTPENDPNKKWAASQSAGSGASAVGNTAGRMAFAAMGAQAAAARGPGGGQVGSGQADADAAQAAAAYQRAEQNARNGFDSPARTAQILQEELDKELFDAVRVTCEISSSKPMRDPYLVIITQYREKDDPPGAVKNWVYAWQLDHLDEKPVKLRILKGGFPPGFEMLNQQFHLYGAGRELGTNVADKNVALTRDEAHQYIVIDHLTTHKGATLAPAVVLGVSHKDFFPHFASVQLQQEIFVKVDKAGRPAGVFRNAQCTEATGDDYLEALVAQARFKPALQAGKAVEGVAKLTIADLAI